MIRRNRWLLAACLVIGLAVVAGVAAALLGVVADRHLPCRWMGYYDGWRCPSSPEPDLIAGLRAALVVIVVLGGALVAAKVLTLDRYKTALAPYRVFIGLGALAILTGVGGALTPVLAHFDEVLPHGPNCFVTYIDESCRSGPQPDWMVGLLVMIVAYFVLVGFVISVRALRVK